MRSPKKFPVQAERLPDDKRYRGIVQSDRMDASKSRGALSRSEREVDAGET